MGELRMTLIFNSLDVEIEIYFRNAVDFSFEYERFSVICMLVDFQQWKSRVSVKI
jgi:hypothetical protein